MLDVFEVFFLFFYNFLKTYEILRYKNKRFDYYNQYANIERFK